MPINHMYISKFFAFIVICSVLYSGLSFAEEVKDWIQLRDGYITQVNNIKARVLQINKDAANWNDPVRALLAGANAYEKAIKELRTLGYPLELQRYHQKLIEGYNLLNQQVGVLLGGDKQAAKNFGLKALECEKESYKELRRVAEQHGAPKKDLDTIDRWISSFPK